MCHLLPNANRVYLVSASVHADMHPIAPDMLFWCHRGGEAIQLQNEVFDVMNSLATPKLPAASIFCVRQGLEERFDILE